MSRFALRLVSSVCAMAVFPIALRLGERTATPPDPQAAERAQAASAASALAAGRFADALTPTLTLAAAYPANHIFEQQLATIYNRLHQPDKEAAAWERFLTTSPSPFEACPAIVDAYVEQGLLPRAGEAADRCLSFAPDDPDMMFYAARSAEWASQFDRAADLYARALAVDDRNLDVQIGLARVSLHREDYDSALRAARGVLERNPNAVDAVLVAAMALQRQGNLAEARREFQRGLALKDSYADLHFGLAMVEESDNHPDVARQEYERALALAPTRADIRDRLARLTGGRP